MIIKPICHEIYPQGCIVLASCNKKCEDYMILVKEKAKRINRDIRTTTPFGFTRQSLYKYLRNKSSCAVCGNDEIVWSTRRSFGSNGVLIVSNAQCSNCLIEYGIQRSDILKEVTYLEPFRS